MPPMPIDYRVGNEHDPTDPFGRVSIQVSPTGEVRLEHVSLSGRRAWTAVAARATLASIQGALAASGFADDQPEIPQPDSAARSLTVAGLTRRIESRAASEPGYARLFAILDALADEISGGTIYRRPRAHPALSSSTTET